MMPIIREIAVEEIENGFIIVYDNNTDHIKDYYVDTLSEYINDMVISRVREYEHEKKHFEYGGRKEFLVKISIEEVK